MGIFYPVKEFFETSGNTAAIFTENLRDEIVRYGCELWQLYPDWMTQNSLPATAFARGFWNSACSPIQAPINPPANPGFSGGQCSGVEYDVDVNVKTENTSNCQPLNFNFTFRVTGAVNGLYEIVEATRDTTTDCQGGNNSDLDRVTIWLGAEGGDVQVLANVYQWSDSGMPQPYTTYTITDITRVDGQPDDCGDPPEKYPSVDPDPLDLVKNTPITVNDGLDLDLELVYVRNSNNYNFPFSMKVNGVNITIDLGGLTIHGNPFKIYPNSDRVLPPPGSDTSVDNDGNDITTLYDNEHPVSPPFAQPALTREEIETIVCNDGVITIVRVIIDITTGHLPLLNLILDLLIGILRDVCGLRKADLCSIGFPEVYSLKSGVERPAIVYHFKEWDGSRWGKPTYTRTLTYPTVIAIAEINTLTALDFEMGTFKATIRLTDGAILQASGNTKANAKANLQWIIDRCEPSRLPSDIDGSITYQENSKLQVKSVKLRKAEYFPMGAGSGISPDLQKYYDV